MKLLTIIANILAATVVLLLGTLLFTTLFFTTSLMINELTGYNAAKELKSYIQRDIK
jgi:hypothetical protein